MAGDVNRPDEVAGSVSIRLGELTSFGDSIKPLVESGILDGDELARLWSSLPPMSRPRNPAELIILLIERKLLTRFQAKALVEGRWQELLIHEYVVIDQIGAGGMGQVLKARHRRMDRVVALKQIGAKHTQDETALKRFQREVKAAAMLSHPNIVTAFDAGDNHGTHFLVMEYVEGSDLSALVKEHGPLSVEQALDCTLQAAKGLAYAHSRGIVHRDVKPANLLLDREGTLKILDMGLAHLDDANDGLTDTQQVMGTVDFMSPEQGCDAKHVDGRADIYSLGCTLWYLLTGERIYQGQSTVQRVMKHREAPIPSLAERCPNVPKEFDALFRRMVGKKPGDRPATMLIVCQEMARLRVKQLATSGQAGADSELGDSLRDLAFPRSSKAAVVTTAIDQSEHSTVPPAAKKLRLAAKNVVGGRRAIRIGPLATAAGLCVALAAIVIYLKIKDSAAVSKVELPTGGSVSIVNEEKDLAAIAPRNVNTAGLKTNSEPAVTTPKPEPTSELSATTAKPGETIINSIGMKLAYIPPGEFDMGSPDDEIGRGRHADDEKLHHVRMTKPFYLGIYAVTQQEYQLITGSNPSGFSAYGNDKNAVKELDTKRFPVENVTWRNAAEFCRLLSEKEKRTYRLPTEAEWEYACRAGTTTPFNFGPALNGDQANCSGAQPYGTDAGSKNLGRPTVVGSYPPNAWGLYDMHGNVWQWCADWYDSGYYAHSPGVDPPGPGRSYDPNGGNFARRVDRGGAFSDAAMNCRAAVRSRVMPTSRYHDVGFRVTMDIGETSSEQASE